MFDEFFSTNLGYSFQRVLGSRMNVHLGRGWHMTPITTKQCLEFQ